jgi:hypothetical protein
MGGETARRKCQVCENETGLLGRWLLELMRLRRFRFCIEASRLVSSVLVVLWRWSGSIENEEQVVVSFSKGK